MGCRLFLSSSEYSDGGPKAFTASYLALFLLCIATFTGILGFQSISVIRSSRLKCIATTVFTTDWFIIAFECELAFHGVFQLKVHRHRASAQ